MDTALGPGIEGGPVHVSCLRVRISAWLQVRLDRALTRWRCCSLGGHGAQAQLCAPNVWSS